MAARLDEYIRHCLDCHRICLETATHLSAAGGHVSPAAIRLLFNCAELARASAGLLRDAGDGNASAGAACAEVCDRAARLCDSFPGDPQMAVCAAACRRCAEAWRQVAAHAA
jgi:hypothetical protein